MNDSLPLPAPEPETAGTVRESVNRRPGWRYILVDQGLVAIIVNFVINWGIARLVFRNLPIVPQQGELSIAGDTVATCWMLPLISCLIVTTLTRNEVRQGRIPSWNRDRETESGLMRIWEKLTENTLARAIFWGLIGRFAVAPLALWGLEQSGLDQIPLQRFLIGKALFACFLGIFFCPFHAWWALHDDVRKVR